MGITKISVEMKSSTQAFVCFSSFATSVANHLQERTNSEGTIGDVMKNYIIPFKNSEEISQKSKDISSKVINSWWNWTTMLFLFSILSIILISSLLYAIRKCLSIKEKEVIKFSSQKTKDGWYRDNLIATEKRIFGQCNITEKDFVVVWS